MEDATRMKEIDGSDFEEMFSQYLPIVYNMYSRYSIRDFDFDDWLQEGRIALDSALKSYRKGHGTTFGLYYKMVFENRIRSILRRQQAKKRWAQQQAVSIEKVGIEAFSEHCQYHEFMDENLYISELLLAGEIPFSSLENRSLYYYLQGEEPFMIAEHLNETEKAINNALNRAKNKIKKKISNLNP